jgi:hypothetical protein
LGNHHSAYISSSFTWHLKQFIAVVGVLLNIIHPMTNYEKALHLFETKAQKIIHKYTVVPNVDGTKYGYLRLAGFFSYFNSTLIDVDEALNKETIGILKKFKDNDKVDFINLLNGLNEHRVKAKLEFIKIQQPWC